MTAIVIWRGSCGSVEWDEHKRGEVRQRGERRGEMKEEEREEVRSDTCGGTSGGCMDPHSSHISIKY